MAVFIVLWPCLFNTKLRCLQKNKYGHTNLAVMFQIEFWSSLLTLYASSQVYNVTQEITRNCVFHKSSAKVS